MPVKTGIIITSVSIRKLQPYLTQRFICHWQRRYIPTTIVWHYAAKRRSSYARGQNIINNQRFVRKEIEHTFFRRGMICIDEYYIDYNVSEITFSAIFLPDCDIVYCYFSMAIS
jgi:hypothetical protein